MKTLEQRLAQLLDQFEWTWDDRDMSCKECGAESTIRSHHPSYHIAPGIHASDCEMDAVLKEARVKGLIE